MRRPESKKIALIVALTLSVGSAGLGQEPETRVPTEAPELDRPETLGKFHPGYGHEWTAASVALNPDGSAHESVEPALREQIAHQHQRSDADQGLSEGQSVPERSPLCAPVVSMIEPIPQESGYSFNGTMLLSEVTVMATVSAVIPGIRITGDPQLLFVLSDAQALRSGSPLPRYVLVPVTGRVIHNTVFCTLNPPGWTINVDTRDMVGSRIVVMGAWRGNATVSLGLNRTGAIAFVQPDETLKWGFAGGPPDLRGLHSRINQAVSSGLFDLTRDFIAEGFGSPRRIEFARALRLRWNSAEECYAGSVKTVGDSPEFLIDCPENRPVQ